MRNNVNFLEYFCSRILKLGNNETRIEIVSDKDHDAKKLKPLVKMVAKALCERHPDLKMSGFYKTSYLWNYNHPFLFGLFSGYVIPIQKDYDLDSVKLTCMELELDRGGKRIVDIDVYRSCCEKVSRENIFGRTKSL